MSAILAIDTSSPEFALALDADGTITSISAPADSESERPSLIDAIDRIIGGDRKRLTGLVVMRGPGSYAGLRVGIATAEGLALALSIPIQGIPTLDAVAAAAQLREGIAIHPAGRGNFGCQEYREGKASGAIFSAGADDLRGKALAGEGAGALGGTEVSAEARCRAALALARPLFEAAETSSIEAVYLREPNITVPRRRVTPPTH